MGQCLPSSNGASATCVCCPGSICSQVTKDPPAGSAGYSSAQGRVWGEDYSKRVYSELKQGT